MTDHVEIPCPASVALSLGRNGQNKPLLQAIAVLAYRFEQSNSRAMQRCLETSPAIRAILDEGPDCDIERLGLTLSRSAKPEWNQRPERNKTK